MTVFRISNTAYKDDISGTGAGIMGARWNSIGIPVLYTAQHISLAVLEMLVNTNFKDYSIALELMYIKLPDQYPIFSINPGSLKHNWSEDPDYTRFIGDEFFTQNESMILQVPSAVIGEEFNFLANPLHRDFKKIKVIKTISFWPDERLFKI